MLTALLLTTVASKWVILPNFFRVRINDGAFTE